MPVAIKLGGTFRGCFPTITPCGGALHNLPMMLMDSLNILESISPKYNVIWCQHSRNPGRMWWRSSFRAPILLSGWYLLWQYPILLMLQDFHRPVTISNTVVDFQFKTSSMVISRTWIVGIATIHKAQNSRLSFTAIPPNMALDDLSTSILGSWNFHYPLVGMAWNSYTLGVLAQTLFGLLWATKLWKSWQVRAAWFLLREGNDPQV